MESRRAHGDGRRRPCWYEVRIPRTAGYQKVGESFLEDYARVLAAEFPADGLRYVTEGSTDRYFLPPDAAAAYFLCENPTALATWLEAIDLAKPCATVPDGKDLKPVGPIPAAAPATGYRRRAAD